MPKTSTRPLGPFCRALYGVHDALVRVHAEIWAQHDLHRRGYRVHDVEEIPQFDVIGGCGYSALPENYSTPQGTIISVDAYRRLVDEQADRIAAPRLWLPPQTPQVGA